jgi:hypothetical protein
VAAPTVPVPASRAPLLTVTAELAIEPFTTSASAGTRRPRRWPAPGSEDTELGVILEPEVVYGTQTLWTRVQA